MKIKQYLLAQPNFTFVTPKLAIGGQTYNLSLYRKFGVTCILNVQSEEHINIEDFVKLGIGLCSIPVADAQPPRLDQIQWAVNWIDNQLSNGAIVCVRCKNGVGRSVAIVAAYLISRGADYSSAIHIIKSVWGKASPNPSQIAAVKEYERDVNITRKELIF